MPAVTLGEEGLGDPTRRMLSRQACPEAASASPGVVLASSQQPSVWAFVEPLIFKQPSCVTALTESDLVGLVP